MLKKIQMDNTLNQIKVDYDYSIASTKEKKKEPAKLIRAANEGRKETTTSKSKEDKKNASSAFNTSKVVINKPSPLKALN